MSCSFVGVAFSLASVLQLLDHVLPDTYSFLVQFSQFFFYIPYLHIFIIYSLIDLLIYFLNNGVSSIVVSAIAGTAGPFFFPNEYGSEISQAQ